MSLEVEGKREWGEDGEWESTKKVRREEGRGGRGILCGGLRILFCVEGNKGGK